MTRDTIRRLLKGLDSVINVVDATPGDDQILVEMEDVIPKFVIRLERKLATAEARDLHKMLTAKGKNT